MTGTKIGPFDRMNVFRTDISWRKYRRIGAIKVEEDIDFRKVTEPPLYEAVPPTMNRFIAGRNRSIKRAGYRMHEHKLPAGAQPAMNRRDLDFVHHFSHTHSLITIEISRASERIRPRSISTVSNSINACCITTVET